MDDRQQKIMQHVIERLERLEKTARELGERLKVLAMNLDAHIAALGDLADQAELLEALETAKAGPEVAK